MGKHLSLKIRKWLEALPFLKKKEILSYVSLYSTSTSTGKENFKYLVSLKMTKLLFTLWKFFLLACAFLDKVENEDFYH